MIQLTRNTRALFVALGAPAALTFAGLGIAKAAQEWTGGKVKIYDAKLIPGIVSLFAKGNLVLVNGKKTDLFAHRDAKAASKNLIQVRDYYREKFGLNSFDGNGANIEASVNVNRFAYPDILGMKHNASWNETRFLFGAGGKHLLDNFPQALDVVAHEFTHAVIQYSSNLTYAGESGALNEHLADFFGAAVQFHYEKPENNFLIGESILRGKMAKSSEALRDMMNPEKGLDAQPRHMDELAEGAEFAKYSGNCVPSGSNDQCGVHVLSGIPNRVSALIVESVGFEKAEKLIYPVMQERLKENSNFSDYASALRSECSSVSADTCQAVDSALAAVGL